MSVSVIIRAFKRQPHPQELALTFHRKCLEWSFMWEVSVSELSGPPGFSEFLISNFHLGVFGGL